MGKDRMMSKDAGFTYFECDRNPKHNGYAKEGTAAAGKYRTIKRVRSDGTSQEFLLCDDCYALYKPIADAQDTAFNQFMTDGKE